MPSTFLHYPGAPIAEAALIVRVRSSAIEKDRLQEICRAEENTYPVRGKPPIFSWQVQSGNDAVASGGEDSEGFQFSTADKKQSFEVRPDTFGFSRFAPYGRWETFQPEARRLWSRYREAVRPDVVELLALRYVNKITIPSNSNLETYFNIYVQTPQQLPRDVTYFVAIAVMHLDDPHSHIMIAMQPAPAESKQDVTIMLDINTEHPVGTQMSDNEIWTIFEKLRHQKNRVFESCITEKIRGMIR